LQSVSFIVESLDLQPNLHPSNVEFLASHIASESIIIPHIPLLKMQLPTVVLCPCDDEMPRDDSFVRLNVQPLISKELLGDDPLNTTPAQIKPQSLAMTNPAVEEIHWKGMFNLHFAKEILVPESPMMIPRPSERKASHSHQNTVHEFHDAQNVLLGFKLSISQFVI
jgi:hypothetical protein